LCLPLVTHYHHQGLCRCARQALSQASYGAQRQTAACGDRDGIGTLRLGIYIHVHPKLSSATGCGILPIQHLANSSTLRFVYENARAQNRQCHTLACLRVSMTRTYRRHYSSSGCTNWSTRLRLYRIGGMTVRWACVSHHEDDEDEPCVGLSHGAGPTAAQVRLDDHRIQQSPVSIRWFAHLT
jgi:hypothetical protein